MDRKKSKYLSETKFWAVGSLKAEKTRGAIMAPPYADRVKKSNLFEKKGFTKEKEISYQKKSIYLTKKGKKKGII